LLRILLIAAQETVQNQAADCPAERTAEQLQIATKRPPKFFLGVVERRNAIATALPN
jgi:hypothetical protein